MKHSVIGFAVFALGMMVVYLINKITPLELDIWHFLGLGIFMFISSSLVHYATAKASEENPKRFPTYFMAITGLKMAAYIVALGVYILIFRRDGIPVVIGFLAFYLIYTTLEVLAALKMTKSKN